MAKILLIEHDQDINNHLNDVFSFEGFEVQTVVDPKEGVNRINKDRFDIVILNIDENDTFENLKEIRRANRIISIFIISERNNEEDKVFALNLGADDFLVKPFSSAELVARIRANLRRMNVMKNTLSNTSINSEYEPVTVKIGDSSIHLDKMIVKQGGNETPLTPKEIGIIRLLHKNRGKVVSRNLLMSEVWGDDVYVTVRVIDTNIVSIRKKIGDTGRKSKFIKTIFGVGYKLVEH